MKQLCTFRVQGLAFGIEVTRVQEVMTHPAVTAVPLAPTTVRGLLNLRGQIVPSIDLRSRLGLPASDLKSAPMSVVLRTSDGPISLTVDEIGDVVDIEDTYFEPIPSTVSQQLQLVLVNVCKLPENLLLILDVDKVIDLDLEAQAA